MIKFGLVPISWWERFCLLFVKTQYIVDLDECYRTKVKKFRGVTYILEMKPARIMRGFDLKPDKLNAIERPR